MEKNGNPRVARDCSNGFFNLHTCSRKLGSQHERLCRSCQLRVRHRRPSPQLRVSGELHAFVCSTQPRKPLSHTGIFSSTRWDYTPLTFAERDALSRLFFREHVGCDVPRPRRLPLPLNLPSAFLRSTAIWLVSDSCTCVSHFRRMGAAVCVSFVRRRRWLLPCVKSSRTRARLYPTNASPSCFLLQASHAASPTTAECYACTHAYSTTS